MKLFDDEFNNQSIGWVYYESYTMSSLVDSLFGLLYDYEKKFWCEKIQV